MAIEEQFNIEKETPSEEELMLATTFYEESRATYEALCQILIENQQSKWKRREKLTASRNINTLISALHQAMIDGVAPSCCDDDEIVLNFVEDFLEESSEARENMNKAKYTLEEFQSQLAKPERDVETTQTMEMMKTQLEVKFTTMIEESISMLNQKFTTLSTNASHLESNVMEKLQSIEHRLQTVEEEMTLLLKQIQTNKVEEGRQQSQILSSRIADLEQKLAQYEYSNCNNKSPRNWCQTEEILTTHEQGIRKVLQLADGRLCTCGVNNSVQIWFLDGKSSHVLIPPSCTPQVLMKGKRKINRYSYQPEIIAWVEYEDNMLATRNSTNNINLWDTIAGVCLRTIDCSSDNCSNMPAILMKLTDGRLASISRTINVWQISNGECVQSIPWQNACSLPPMSRIFCLDDNQIAAFSGGCALQIYDLKKSENLTGIRLDHDVAGNVMTVLKDGRVVSTGSGSTFMQYCVRIWESTTEHNAYSNIDRS
jgi:hypothetical protein